MLCVGNQKKNGSFSVKSLYNFIGNPGPRYARMLDMWEATCPIKVNSNFLWLCFRGQTQSDPQLATRKWPSCGQLKM
jgi:hypothetical protein